MFNPGFFPIITAEDTKRRQEEYQTTTTTPHVPRSYKPIEISTEFLIVGVLVFLTVVAILWPSKK